MYRVKASNLLMAVGTLFGLAALFSLVGRPSQLESTVSGAQIDWRVAALDGTVQITVPSAIGLMGAPTIRLPLMRTTELQLSMIEVGDAQAAVCVPPKDVLLRQPEIDGACDGGRPLLQSAMAEIAR
jgi:hypothetical protein